MHILGGIAIGSAVEAVEDRFVKTQKEEFKNAQNALKKFLSGDVKQFEQKYKGQEMSPEDMAEAIKGDVMEQVEELVEAMNESDRKLFWKSLGIHTTGNAVKGAALSAGMTALAGIFPHLAALLPSLTLAAKFGAIIGLAGLPFGGPIIGAVVAAAFLLVVATCFHFLTRFEWFRIVVKAASFRKSQLAHVVQGWAAFRYVEGKFGKPKEMFELYERDVAYARTRALLESVTKPPVADGASEKQQSWSAGRFQRAVQGTVQGWWEGVGQGRIPRAVGSVFKNCGLFSCDTDLEHSRAKPQASSFAEIVPVNRSGPVSVAPLRNMRVAPHQTARTACKLKENCYCNHPEHDL